MADEPCREAGGHSILDQRLDHRDVAQVAAVGGDADEREWGLDGPLGSSRIPLEEKVKLDYL